MVRGSWLVARKKRDCRMCDSLFGSIKFVVFSLQQIVKNLKPTSTNYKLRTINYKVKGASYDGRSLHATAPLGVLSFQFVVNRKSTSQTAFGGQLPYQGSQRDAPANCELRPAGRPLGVSY